MEALKAIVHEESASLGTIGELIKASRNTATVHGGGSVDLCAQLCPALVLSSSLPKGTSVERILARFCTEGLTEARLGGG